MQLRHVSTNLRQGLRRNLSMHASVIITLFVSLTLAGIGVLLNQQASLTTDVIGSELQVKVYLCAPDDTDYPQCTSEVTAEQEAAILQTIRDNPEVRGEPEVISKEEGLDNIVELGIVTEDQVSGPDPLITEEFIPKEIRITLVDPNDFDGVESAVQDLDGVRSIVPAKDLVGPVFTILDVIKWSAWGASVTLLLAAVMLVTNTIRLNALARRKEIEIMRLVGASDAFIRWPFVFEGAFVGFLGAVVTLVVLAAAAEPLSGFMVEFFRVLPLQAGSLTRDVVILVMGAGVGLGIVGSWVSVRTYLIR